MEQPSWKYNGQNDSMLAYQEEDVNMKEDLGFVLKFLALFIKGMFGKQKSWVFK